MLIQAIRSPCIFTYYLFRGWYFLIFYLIPHCHGCIQQGTLRHTFSHLQNLFLSQHNRLFGTEFKCYLWMITRCHTSSVYYSSHQSPLLFPTLRSSLLRICMILLLWPSYTFCGNTISMTVAAAEWETFLGDMFAIPNRMASLSLGNEKLFLHFVDQVGNWGKSTWKIQSITCCVEAPGGQWAKALNSPPKQRFHFLIYYRISFRLKLL